MEQRDSKMETDTAGEEGQQGGTLVVDKGDSGAKYKMSTSNHKKDKISMRSPPAPVMSWRNIKSPPAPVRSW